MSREGASPVSFEVSVARLPKKGMPVTLEADEAQRAALAREHGLVAVEAFRADLVVSHWNRDGARVHGRVVARIVQNCVVTLEPLEALIGEDIDSVFVPEGSRLARPSFTAEGEMVLDAEGDDPPEQFAGETIDVGQLAEEHFALAIDPYPKRQGAGLPEPEPQEEPRGPLFDKLKGLKDLS
jgi:hypothetical protein